MISIPTTGVCAYISEAGQAPCNSSPSSPDSILYGLQKSFPWMETEISCATTKEIPDYWERNGLKITDVGLNLWWSRGSRFFTAGPSQLLFPSTRCSRRASYRSEYSGDCRIPLCEYDICRMRWHSIAHCIRVCVRARYSLRYVISLSGFVCVYL